MASVSVCALKENQLELSTLNLVDIQCMAVACHALTLRSKGQGHVVIKCVAGVGMQVDMTASVFSLSLCTLTFRVGCTVAHIVPSTFGMQQLANITCLAK